VFTLGIFGLIKTNPGVHQTSRQWTELQVWTHPEWCFYILTVPRV